MDRPVFLVTGANGQLGQCLRDISANYPAIRFVFCGKQEMPLDDFEKVSSLLTQIKPSVVINAAAYTAVDKAETEKEQAFLINGAAVGNLAAACQAIGAQFIHVSTDYVFNGNASQPYQENDPVDPVNSYGASKLKGEELAFAANSHSVIIRTSWVYSRHGANFVKTMLRLMKDRPSLNVVADQVGCPTYAPDLAEAIVAIATAGTQQSGIYHFSNSGPITWFDFAVAINQLAGYSCQVQPIPTTAYPTPARRPAYSVMDNRKMETSFGIGQKNWKERLALCISEIMAPQ